jgi:hypothetical protein
MTHLVSLLRAGFFTLLWLTGTLPAYSEGLCLNGGSASASPPGYGRQ